MVFFKKIYNKFYFKINNLISKIYNKFYNNLFKIYSRLIFYHFLTYEDSILKFFIGFFWDSVGYLLHKIPLKLKSVYYFFKLISWWSKVLLITFFLLLFLFLETYCQFPLFNYFLQSTRLSNLRLCKNLKDSEFLKTFYTVLCDFYYFHHIDYIKLLEVWNPFTIIFSFIFIILSFLLVTLLLSYRYYWVLNKTTPNNIRRFLSFFSWVVIFLTLTQTPTPPWLFLIILILFINIAARVPERWSFVFLITACVLSIFFIILLLFLI